MPDITTDITLNGKICIHNQPGEYGKARGLANSYWCPVGPTCGRAWVLMIREDVRAIQADTSFTLRFETSQSDVDLPDVAEFPGLLLVKTERLLTGGIEDPNGIYLVELADTRYLLERWSDTEEINVNIRSYANDTDFLTGTGANTWTDLVQTIWEKMTPLGAFPGLPYIPSGIPENWRFHGVSAWDALHEVLGKLGCTTAYNPFASSAAFRIVRLGDPQTVPAILTQAENLNAEPLENNATKIPETIRVYFHTWYRSYGQQRDTELATNWSTTDVAESIDIATNVSGAVSGTILQLWDDLPRVLDEDNVLTNSSGLSIRAAEVASNWLLDAQIARQYQVLLGTQTSVVPGSQVKAVLWRHWNEATSGGGTATEIIRHPGLPMMLRGRGVDTTEFGPVDENLAPPDIARKSYPNTPRLPNIVQIDDTGESPGADILPNADGFFPGHVARWVAGSLVILEDCWVRLIDDHDNDDGQVTAKNQDYFHARLSGVETSDATLLPVYLARKGEFSLSIDGVFGGPIAIPSGSTLKFTAPTDITTTVADAGGGVFTVDFANQWCLARGLVNEVSGFTSANATIAVDNIVTIFGKQAAVTQTVANVIGASGENDDVVYICYNRSGGDDKWEIIEAPPTTGMEDWLGSGDAGSGFTITDGETVLGTGGAAPFEYATSFLKVTASDGPATWTYDIAKLIRVGKTTSILTAISGDTPGTVTCNIWEKGGGAAWQVTAGPLVTVTGYNFSDVEIASGDWVSLEQSMDDPTVWIAERLVNNPLFSIIDDPATSQDILVGSALTFTDSPSVDLRVSATRTVAATIVDPMFQLQDDGANQVDVNHGDIITLDGIGVIEVIKNGASNFDFKLTTSFTDNAIIRNDSAGNTIQGSIVIVTDAGVMSGLTGLTSVGFVNFGGADPLEIPNSDTPTVDADGEIAFDNNATIQSTDFSTGIIRFFGHEEQGIVTMPIAEFSSPTDDHVVTYDATANEFQLKAQTGGSGLDTVTVDEVDLANFEGRADDGDATVNLAGTTVEFEAGYGIELKGVDASDRINIESQGLWAKILANSGDGVSVSARLVADQAHVTEASGTITLLIRVGAEGNNLRLNQVVECHRMRDGTFVTSAGASPIIGSLRPNTTGTLTDGWEQFNELDDRVPLGKSALPLGDIGSDTHVHPLTADGQSAGTSTHKQHQHPFSGTPAEADIPGTSNFGAVSEDNCTGDAGTVADCTVSQSQTHVIEVNDVSIDGGKVTKMREVFWEHRIN